MNSGFWRRFFAYVIDATGVTVLVLVLFGAIYGFDDFIGVLLASQESVEARAEFLNLRDMIRNISFFVLLAFGAIFEASPIRATPGKYLLGIQVVDCRGDRMSVLQAIGRNAAKALSYFVLALGFVAIGFSVTKQGWHDRLAKTFVIHRGRAKRGHAGNLELEETAYEVLRSFEENLAKEPSDSFSIETIVSERLRADQVHALWRDQRLGSLMKFLKMYNDALVHGFPDVTMGVSLDRAAELVETMLSKSTQTDVFIAPKVYAWSRYLKAQ